MGASSLTRISGTGAHRPRREIAEELKVHIKTVESHRMHLMKRLGIHDVAGLVRYAIRHKVVLNE